MVPVVQVNPHRNRKCKYDIKLKFLMLTQKAIYNSIPLCSIQYVQDLEFNVIGIWVRKLCSLNKNRVNIDSQDVNSAYWWSAALSCGQMLVKGTG